MVISSVDIDLWPSVRISICPPTNNHWDITVRFSHNRVTLYRFQKFSEIINIGELQAQITNWLSEIFDIPLGNFQEKIEKAIVELHNQIEERKNKRRDLGFFFIIAGIGLFVSLIDFFSTYDVTHWLKNPLLYIIVMLLYSGIWVLIKYRK